MSVELTAFKRLASTGNGLRQITKAVYANRVDLEFQPFFFSLYGKALTRDILAGENRESAELISENEFSKTYRIYFKPEFLKWRPANIKLEKREAEILREMILNNGSSPKHWDHLEARLYAAGYVDFSMTEAPELKIYHRLTARGILACEQFYGTTSAQTIQMVADDKEAEKKRQAYNTITAIHSPGDGRYYFACPRFRGVTVGAEILNPAPDHDNLKVDGIIPRTDLHAFGVFLTRVSEMLVKARNSGNAPDPMSLFNLER